MSPYLLKVVYTTPSQIIFWEKMLVILQHQKSVTKNLPVEATAISTSLASRNEPRNTGLHNGIEPDPQLDSFADLPHGVLGKS